MVNNRPRLAIITSHPIQYHAPLFTILAQRQNLDLRVFYTWGQSKEAVYDPAFGHTRIWDIPLLQGYDHNFLENTAKNPGSHHFNGIRNPRLVKAVEAWGANAILVFGWSFHSHLACMRHFKGKVPVFFRGDSTLLDERGGPRTWLRRAFLRWVYRQVDKAFYTGQANRAYFLAHGLKIDNLVPAPHAVDNERFSSGSIKAASAALRASMGLTADDFVILFAGKLEPKKNPIYLLRLAGKIRDPQVKFLLVGNGPLETVLREKAAGDKRFLFLSFQNQSAMPAVYGAADCFLLPSTGPGETWGLAANEAMACGLPVILSEKAGGAVDLVNGNGLIFNPDETGAVVSYIRKLKVDAAFRDRAKQNSLLHIQRFRFDDFAAALEQEMQMIHDSLHRSPAQTSYHSG